MRSRDEGTGDALFRSFSHNEFLHDADSIEVLSPVSDLSSQVSGPSRPTVQFASPLEQAPAASEAQSAMRRVQTSPGSLTEFSMVSSSFLDFVQRAEDPDPATGMRRVQSLPVDLDSLDKTQRKLAKKAEAARVSRKKKKDYIQALEEKLYKLSARLAELEAGPNEMKGKVQDMYKRDQDALKEKLAMLMRDPDSNQEEIKHVMISLVGLSKKKNAATEYFLDKCESCLVPGLQVKFALWALSQDDDFYDKPGLWKTVMGGEIGLSPEQMEELKKFREPVMQIRGCLSNLQVRMKKLREQVRTHLQSRHQHVEELQELMTPEQIARFSIWVDKNPLCMQMLNTVWRT